MDMETKNRCCKHRPSRIPDHEIRCEKAPLFARRFTKDGRHKQQETSSREICTPLGEEDDESARGIRDFKYALRVVRIVLRTR